MIPLLNAEYHNPLEHWIRTRTIRHNQNFMGIFLGETGQGKSYSSISLGEGCDPRFKIANVAASAKEMIEFLVDKKHPKGTSVVLDEAGVNFSNRKWMKKENKALGELFQTFRWMNIALLFTLPNFTFLDSQQRKLCHFSFESPIINRVHSLCFVRGKYIQHDDFSDKMKKYYPMMRYKDGKLAKVARIGFRLASPELLKQYEAKKYSWNQGMLDKTRKVIVQGLDVDNLKKVKNQKDWILKYELDGKALRVANEVQKNIDEYLVIKGKRKGWAFNTETIRADFVVKGIETTRIVRYMMKKPKIIEYIQLKNDESKIGGSKNVKRIQKKVAN